MITKYLVCGILDGELNFEDVRRVFGRESDAQNYVAVHHDCTYTDIVLARGDMIDFCRGL